MTIDEAIAHAREVAEGKYRDASMYFDDNGLYAREYAECKFCAEEHEQLAEWLEELKAIKEGTVFYSNRPIEDIVLEARNDAIEKFKQTLIEIGFSRLDGKVSSKEIEFYAEQLKEN